LGSGRIWCRVQGWLRWWPWQLELGWPGWPRAKGVARPGRHPGVEVPALVAGMVAGANSINDMDLLRRGAMGRLFSVVWAPSTLSILLRAFTFGKCLSA
jgi:hypothetical protein